MRSAYCLYHFRKIDYKPYGVCEYVAHGSNENTLSVIPAWIMNHDNIQNIQHGTVLCAY